MKICIIGIPRSRSSILLETISEFYNIKILGEHDINSLEIRYGEEYINAMRSMLEKNSNFSTGVIRFHPLQMIANRPFRILNFDWFKFDQYDKIFFTYRKSISDNIASNLVATKINKFTYKSKDEIKTNLGSFEFTQEDYYHVRDYYRSIHVMEQLKEYLKLYELKWTDLDYDEIPRYIQNNYPGIIVSHVETKYQYDKIISNFNDIIKIYNETKLH